MRAGPHWHDRRGTAALEFAVVLPVLVVILTALADLTNATLTWWRLAQAADAVGRIATSLAAGDSNANVLTQEQARVASTAALSLLPELRAPELRAPELRAAASPRAGVVLSAVVFAPVAAGCTQNCAYVARVAWSASLQGGLPARPCGTLSPAADGARPQPTTLPASAYGATSVLVVDVAAETTPLVTTLLGSAVRMAVAGLMAARTGGPGDWIRLTGPTAAGLRCPGYV